MSFFTFEIRRRDAKKVQAHLSSDKRARTINVAFLSRSLNPPVQNRMIIS